MLEENFEYGMVSRYQQHNYISLQFLEACYRAGDTVLAEKVSRSVKKDLEQQINYYGNLEENKLDQFRSDKMPAVLFIKINSFYIGIAKYKLVHHFVVHPTLINRANGSWLLIIEG